MSLSWQSLSFFCLALGTRICSSGEPVNRKMYLIFRTVKRVKAYSQVLLRKVNSRDLTKYRKINYYIINENGIWVRLLHAGICRSYAHLWGCVSKLDNDKDWGDLVRILKENMNYGRLGSLSPDLPYYDGILNTAASFLIYRSFRPVPIEKWSGQMH